MKYKFSDYLLAMKDYNEDYILYDTLTYNTVLIKKDDFSKFDDIRLQILTRGDYNGPRENLDLLLKHNIIRHIDDNVRDELQKRYKEAVLSNKVLNFIILPTEQCNFRCVYCYENFALGKMKKQTINKTIELLEHLLPDYNILNLSWFGGEPLLAMDVIRTISEKARQLCKKYKKPYFSQITTNGYLLNLSIVKELLKMHTMVFQVTIDGDRNSHNRQRHLADGSGTYDVILQNLYEIKKNIKTKTIKIIIRVNVSKDMNIDEINSVAELFDDDDRFVINIQKIFDDSGKEKIGGNYHNYLDKIDKCHKYISDDLTAENTICYAAKRNTIMIRSDGTLGKCTVNFDDPNNNYGNISSIDISNFSLNSIEYCNCLHNEEDCIRCCIYPLCFGRQCPAKRYQLCKNMIDKYMIVLKTYSSKAHVLQFI